MAIDYEAKEWADGSGGGTPIMASDLNRIENGIADSALGVDTLNKRLVTYLVAQDGDTAQTDIYGDTITGPCLVLDLAERATYYLPGADDESQDRVLIVSGSDVDAIRDSVSRTQLDLTPNTSLANYSTYTNCSVRDGDSVTLQCSIVLSESTNWNSDELLLFTLPDGARPSATRNLYRMCLCSCSGSLARLRGIRIGTDGRVTFLNQSGGTSDVVTVVIPGITFLL